MTIRLSASIAVGLLVLSGPAVGSHASGIKDVESSARRGDYLQAFAQSRALLDANPSAGDLAELRTLFDRFPRIADDGIDAIERTIDAARNERELIRAQSDVVFVSRCAGSNICAAGSLARLQGRFATAAATLILDAGIPVTFESNLLANWTTSAGASPGEDVERRIFQNTLANIAARDPQDSPSVLMADRLFRYLVREPVARDEAFEILARVCWQQRDVDGPMREVYPELAAKRRAELDRAPTPGRSPEPGLGQTVELDARGVEFGPWVRNFRASVNRNWVIPYEAMSKRGHVSVAADVHRDGRVSDVVVTVPSGIDAFNTASSNAVSRASAHPLPPGYPEKKVLVVVTFYYNESLPKK